MINEQKSTKRIIAFVGMPGSGKTEASTYLFQKNIPFVRFGTATEERLTKDGLPVTPENESLYREKIRKEIGMHAYAVLSEPKIDLLLQENDVIVVDGLYSWEEYIYLKTKYPFLIIVHVYAEPPLRYARISRRAIRPFTFEEAKKRDVSEIEKLNKGGPIAIADFLVENNTDIESLHSKIDTLLQNLGGST